jgi:dTDP-4-dehydrorhamnose 3,5-epimerase
MDFITLQNQNEKVLVKDVLLHPLKVNRDESGTLVETLRSDWKNIYGKDREFAMQYYSKTPSGLARDEGVWHYHPEQEDRFLVIVGEIVAAVADNRKGSETEGLLNLFYMEADESPYILLIPKQTLHGFMVISKDSAILLNFPTRIYKASEEKRIPHEEANIKLPDGRPFLWDLVRKEFPSQAK